MIKRVRQIDIRDCGVSCLKYLINYYGGYATREYLRDITKTTINGVSVYSLVKCANMLGMEAKAVKTNIISLKNNCPFIAHIITNSKLGHFVVVTNVSDKHIKVMDPNYGFRTYKLSEWETLATNIYILYELKGNIIKQEKEKSFIKTIIPMMKKYKITFFIILFLSLIYSISEIFIAYVFKYLLNINILQIKYLLIFLILVILLKAISNLFRNNLINYLNHSLDNTLIKEIYNHIIRLPYLYFKNRTKGDMITRIEDSYKIRDLISKLFVSVTIDLVFIMIILNLIFNLNYKIGLFIIFITIIFILINIIYNNILTKKIQILKEKQSIVNNYLIETISSIDTIKNMQIEDYLNSKLDFNYNNFLNYSFNLNSNYNIQIFIQEFIIGVGILLIFYYSLIENNVSTLIILYNLFLIYFQPVSNLCLLHLLYKDSKVSFIRINELLNINIENLNINSNKTLNNIIINNLEYSYNGINDVIKCKKLIINKSNKVLLYGESGGGKSTLMKLIVKLINNYKGKILIDNKELSNYSLYNIRSRITYVSNDDALYTDTIYNNIVLNNKVNKYKYLKIIKICGIDKIIEKNIMGSKMILDNNGSNLSAGERKRIIIARSLIKESDIYIFDEITNSLDNESERVILYNIFRYFKHKTFIIISHRLSNKDLYQKLVLVKKGYVYEY